VQKKKKCVLNIFRVWDEEFFPRSKSSLGGKSKDTQGLVEVGHQDAMAALNEDEEEDEGSASDGDN
jgi:hypothetical protein